MPEEKPWTPLEIAHAQASELLERKDLEGALVAAREALSLAPAEGYNHWLAGSIQIRMARPEWPTLTFPPTELTGKPKADLESAIESFREAWAGRRKPPGWLIDLCYALLEAKRDDQAVALMQGRIESPNHVLASRARNWLGWYFTYRHPNLELAKGHCLAATELDPSWGTSWLNLAYVEDRLGQITDAYVHYTEALRCKPYNADYATKRKTELEADLQARGIPVPPLLYGASSNRLLGAPYVAIEQACRDGRFADAADLLQGLGDANTYTRVDALEIAERGAEAAEKKGAIREALVIMRFVKAGNEKLFSWYMKEQEGDEYRTAIEKATKRIARLERKAQAR